MIALQALPQWPLHSPTKVLRARIIADHLRELGRPLQVVCLTCGNAADALRAEGIDVLEVGPRGVLGARAWLRPEDVTRMWPHLFDATPGHLPLPLMTRLAHALRDAHGLAPERTDLHLVPSGSGETITALRMAYPRQVWQPLHSDHPAIDVNAALHAPLLQLPQQRPPIYVRAYDPTAALS